MDWLKEKGLLFCVKEYGKNGDNPHFQGIMKCMINTLRSYFKRVFVGGNAKWSVAKTTNIDQYVQYLCKGVGEGSEIRYNEGYDVNEKKRQSDEYVEQKKKRRRIDNALDVCYEAIKEEMNGSQSSTVIIAAIIKWYDEMDLRLPSVGQMSTMARTYAVWNNRKNLGPDKLSYQEQACRLFGSISF